MGFVINLLDRIEDLIAQGADVDSLIATAKGILSGNRDANPEEWEQLNRALKKLPEQSPEQRQQADLNAARSGDTDAARRVVQGDQPTKLHADRHVSSSEPGSPDNPIGYPGTDQDQDAPGDKSNRVAPGQKVTKKDKK